jgi:ABC-type branched-subunit amino acid transport system ATPase component
VTKLLHSWSQINDYLPLIGGVLLILTLMFAQDGLFEANRRWFMRMFEPLAAKAGRRWGRSRVAAKPLRPATVSRVPARSLTVRGVSVSFGGLQAVDGVSLEVRPGEVHGLIGPNGAGKTTLIDAITGFAKANRGSVLLGDVDISSWPARKRSSAGLARSFQSLELFTDLTVRENLAVASEHSGALRYLFDLVRPGSIRLSDAALEALHQFELQDLVDVRPSDVSFGQRKTVAIARSIARSPSVLLLDEPAAGLDDREADELAVLIRHLADAWGVAVLLVEHKVDMIMSISDRVTVLDGGRVLAAGTPAEVRANADVLDAYLGRPAPAAAA